MSPVFSVVIPTRNRPGMLRSAVSSALVQTFEDLEVIVIIDGPDPATLQALASFSDSRLQYIELAESRGGNNARNTGAAMAKGKYIAFLDDDDEWMPTKLERQWRLLEQAGEKLRVASCRFVARAPEGDAIWPRRLAAAGESVGDYLFLRYSLTNGETALNTSTLTVPKRLMDEVQFDLNVKRHQEADWLLRASDRFPIELVFVPEAEAIINCDDRRPRITNTHAWRQSLEWIRSHRKRLTARAYSGFILIQLAGIASRQRAWSSFWPLLSEAIRAGSPNARQLFLFFCMWLVPPSVRPRLASVLRSRPASNSLAKVRT
jgi:glycosyltransferase involved in cell wall biosynthesis